MNILLIDPFPEQMLNAIRALGANVEYHPALSRAEILQRLPWAHVLVLNSRIRVDAEAISVGKNLKLVCRAGVGMDHFDLNALEKAGIIAFNTPGANADSVAEQTIGMLLSMMHWIPRADRQVRNFQWMREMNRGSELLGKTVGVIGHGATGSAVARKLAGFGCHVLAYDKYKTGFQDSHVTEGSYDTLFAQSDIITFHVPLTDETRGWVNEKFISSLPRPVWLLNLSRGPVVELPALLSGLKNGKVRGAAIDVLPNEQLDQLNDVERSLYEELFSFENVILTPHIGGWSFESLGRINGRIVEEIRKII